MRLVTMFRRLGRNDARLIGRDAFLIYLLAYINLVALALRFALPALNARFTAQGILSSPLSEWYPMIVAYFLIYLGAALVGMIFGFVLLEEKDDHTLQAMLVTPLPMQRYVAWRVGVAMGIAFLQVIAAALTTNVATPPLWQLSVIAAGASLSAPLALLYIATFAENKVQGLALTKFIGMSGFLIALAWFTSPPLQFLFGLFPPYWISKAYWLALDGDPRWSLAWALGVMLQTALILLLLKRFSRIAYR